MPTFIDEAGFAASAAVAFVVALVYGMPLLTVELGERLYRFWFGLRVGKAFGQAFGVREAASVLLFQVLGMPCWVLSGKSLLVDSCILETFTELRIFTAAVPAHVRLARLLAPWICLRIDGMHSLSQYEFVDEREVQ